MSSPKKVASNRINGRKSDGPRTAAGKARSSRNARLHGLAAFGSTARIMSDQIRQMVDAICDGDDDPLLREEAVAIAESQLWLACIGREKVAVLEQLRDPNNRSLTWHKSRQGYAEIRAKIDLRFRLYDLALEQVDEVNALLQATKRAGRDHYREPLPAHLEAAWPPAFLRRRHHAQKERDEHQVLREGIRDVERLLRYEKRAWSRLKKAICRFMVVKIDKFYDFKPAVPPQG